MKKLICVLVTAAVLAAGLFAEEKIRFDVVMGDTISSNVYTTANTTNLGLRIGLNDNKVGILAGGMVREAFATVDLPAFPTDFYWTIHPYIGVELWNVEVLGGCAFFGEEITPYASICYNLDLIKPEEGFTDRLSLKMGLEYYIDQFQSNYGPYKDSEYKGLNAMGVDIMSIIVPKLTVGFQYSFGWGF